MSPVYTSTRTRTSIYIPGGELAAKQGLENLANMMRRLGNEREKDLQDKGVKFEETNDPQNLPSMIYQWKEMAQYVFGRTEELSAIIDELNKIDIGPESSESGGFPRENKLK